MQKAPGSADSGVTDSPAAAPPRRVLTTPLAEHALRSLRVGDVVCLTGRLVTGRDDVHHRVVHDGVPPPIDLTGLALFHAGPIVRPEEGTPGTVVSIGPTSSIRMEEDAPEFLRRTGVRLMIGKGGMGPKSAAACRELGAVHCVAPGGCAVSLAQQVEEIEAVHWPELGMPECMWVLRVRELGPLVVSIDSAGGNLFAAGRAEAAARREAAMQPALDFVRDFQTIEAP